MKADQIIEHCHLVRSKGGQHVVAVMHGVVDAVMILDGLPLSGGR